MTPYPSASPRWLASLSLVALAAALLFPGCATNSDQVEAENVKGGIQDLRWLSFVNDVPFVSRSNDEAREMMTAKLTRDNSDEDLRVSGEVGAMTGLFPAGTDLRSKEIELMNQQIAGFYDPHDKIMVQVRGKSALGSALAGHPQFAGELLEAHELTHALQDQHFDLEAMLRRVKDDDDAEIALHSVIEGDATLAGLGYISGGLTEDLEKKIVDHFATMPDSFEPESTNGTPLALSAPLMFQYVQGTRFVAEAWQRGGWAAVDAIYHDPPRSTQEIINPALYFDQRPPVTKISLGGYDTLLAGWNKADEDNFGELLIKLILQRNLPPKSPALSLPTQWRADQMIALKKNNALMLIWMIAFRDRASAEDFASTYASVLDKLKTASTGYRVTTEANTVLVVLGPDSLPLTELAPAVWKASKITIAPSEKSAPVPTRNADFGIKPIAAHS
jgi:hypothetical protein